MLHVADGRERGANMDLMEDLIPVAGACRCGAVSYRLAGDALPATYVCHCLDCQTWSGSAFAEHALIPAGELELDGATTLYAHDGQGVISTQVICQRCHTRIYNRNSAVPGMVVLRAGTLTASDRLTPVAHIWVKRKQAWITVPEGVPIWQETPTPEEFRAAIQKGTH